MLVPLSSECATKSEAKAESDQQTATTKVESNPDVLRGPNSVDATGVKYLLSAEQLENTQKVEDAMEQLQHFRKKAATRLLTFCQFVVDGAGVSTGQLQRQILESTVSQDFHENYKICHDGTLGHSMLACWFDQGFVS